MSPHTVYVYDRPLKVISTTSFNPIAEYFFTRPSPLLLRILYDPCMFQSIALYALSTVLECNGAPPQPCQSEQVLIRPIGTSLWHAALDTRQPSTTAFSDRHANETFRTSLLAFGWNLEFLLSFITS